MAAYADLGKNAKKILTEGYNGHTAKINVNHGVTKDCTITTSTSLDTQTSEHAYAVDLATKLVSPDKGVTVVDKRGINKEWVGSHSLVATVTNLCDVKNLVLTADDNGKLTFAYKNDFLNETCDYVQETQTLKPTICLSHSGIAAGLQTTISRQPGLEHGPKGTNIAVGYLGKMIDGHVHMDNDMAKLGCSLWGKMGNVEGAIQASQVVETHKVVGEIGARYSFEPTFFIGAKVDSDQNVGLCIKKGFNDNSISVSTSVSTLIRDIGKAEIGAGLDFSHNFEFLQGLTGGGGNKSKNNSSLDLKRPSTPKPMSLTAEAARKRRVGATSKQLGENCTDPKCKPIKKYWE